MPRGDGRTSTPVVSNSPVPNPATRRRLGIAADHRLHKTSGERVLEHPKTYFRRVKASDRKELLALTRSSRELHYPWISPPLTSHMFKVYLRRTQRDDHEGFVICLDATDEMVGVINVNNVVKGAFRSASIGYYASQAHVGRGYMCDGLMQVKQYLFRDLGMHRIEANIQPANTASIRLVRSCGFQYEGLSPAFLYINGAWRDHERWASIDPRPGLT